MLLNRIRLPIFQELEKAVEDACKEGDIRFNLRYSRGTTSSHEIMDYLSVHLQGTNPQLSSNEKIKNFARKRIGNLKFSSNLALFDSAKIYFNGKTYHTEAFSALEICRTLLIHITPFERSGKVTIFGTDYFQRFKFQQRKIPEAPEIYHTDHQKSKMWKKYLMSLS